jgi:hypothetical protein
MPVEIEVERKEADIEYHVERIIEEMLKEGMRELSDTRDYKVTISGDEKHTETITAKISIELTRVSDTLLEKAELAAQP